MPFRRKTRKPRFRRRRRRRTTQGRSNKAPLPNSFYTKLRYTDSISVQNSFGNASTYLFRANSLFDPDFTGIGHQPRGFHQFMTLYNKYTVVGAKITLSAAPEEVDGNGENFVFGIAQRNTSGSASTNLQDYTEGRNVKSRMMSNGLSTEAKLMTSSMNIGRYLGSSKPLSDATLQGDASSGPTNEAFFYIFSAAPRATANTRIQYQVTVEYTAVFTHPKVLSQS